VSFNAFTLDLPRALLRGRYSAAVAHMEATGIPIDAELHERLRENWASIRTRLINEVDQRYSVYRDGRLNPRLWGAWLNRNRVRWPRLRSGQLDLRLDVFRDVAKACPNVRPVKELQALLAQLRVFQLAVGADGRNRCALRPFASKTGRNQPSSSQFIFGQSAWLRGLIKPERATALAYVDYAQQEFGIAAALSGDPAMMSAYRTGDPYVTFAKQAGAVPHSATKTTHWHEREQFKLCALGVQYGMGCRSLAARSGQTFNELADCSSYIIGPTPPTGDGSAPSAKKGT
jgi:DNA polymerase I